ncbi:MAG: HAD-IB family hydrolase, partial [Hymenobacter sp.]
MCQNFAEHILPDLIRKDAWDAIEKHKANNDEVVVVSASAENWIEQWCIRHQLKFIGTQLELKNDLLTGNITGLNCNGN